MQKSERIVILIGLIIILIGTAFHRSDARTDDRNHAEKAAIGLCTKESIEKYEKRMNDAERIANKYKNKAAIYFRNYLLAEKNAILAAQVYHHLVLQCTDIRSER
ncbi:MAG: hypothetical protein ISN28_14710 [Ectothiorhodospiraceae bacterium AqS1]|nr:hypothetical protein [Ectothiorhodospiraceae bacterium AqS1]